MRRHEGQEEGEKRAKRPGGRIFFNAAGPLLLSNLLSSSPWQIFLYTPLKFVGCKENDSMLCILGTAMIARLLKMQSLGDDEEFFSSISSVIATSPG